MKTKHLGIIVLGMLTALTIFSCRRNFINLIKDQAVSSDVLESAKIFHAQNTAGYTDLRVQSNGKSLVYPKLKPKWNDSWMAKTNSGEYLVVTAPERKTNSSLFNIRRVFLFNVSGDQVTGGRIFEFLGHNYNVSDNLEKLIANAGKPTIEGFDGEIYEYDINYRDVRATSYVDGKKSSNKVDLKAEKAVKFRSKETSLAVNALRTNNTVDYDFSSDWPWWLDEDCTIYYTVFEYWTNNHLDAVYFRFDWYECPEPEVPTESGSGSGSGSGTASQSQAQNEDPPYGGGGTGGGGSTNSQFNRDIDTSDMPDCFKNVLTKLQTQSLNVIPDVIKAFSGNDPAFSWKIEGHGSNAAVNGSTYPDTENGKPIIRTEVYEANLTNGSQYAVARVILHEGIHAYLRSYYKADLATFQLTYPEMVNYWITHPHPEWNETHHEGMSVNGMVGMIQTRLKALAQAEHAADPNFPIPTDEYLMDLSWGGLEDTAAFIALPSTVKDRIRKNIQREDKGQDNSGNQKLGKPNGC